MTRAGQGDLFAQRMSSAVRGPAALREDIADEIADHLACHAAEERDDDPAAAEQAAIRAFGDPQRIARELRSIHLGDRIMLQRVVIAVLVVIVLGLAANAYFTWTTAKQQGQQFAQMNERLGSLVQLQQEVLHPKPVVKDAAANKPAPGAVKLYCYAGSPEKPAANYKLVLGIPQVGDKQLETGSDGWLDLSSRLLATGQSYHVIRGEFMTGSDASMKAPGFWYRHVGGLPEPGKTEVLRCNVGPQDSCAVRVVLSPDVTWDLRKMKRAKLKLEGKAQATSQDYTSSDYDIQLGKDNTLTGLFPGKAKATLRFIIEREYITRKGSAGAQLHRPRALPPGTRSSPPRPSPSPESEETEAIGVQYVTDEVVIPEGGGVVTLNVSPDLSKQVSGLIFDGSPDRPIVGKEVEYLWWLSDRAPYYNEFFLTDAGGRFASLPSERLSRDLPSNYEVAIAFAWPTVDGKPGEVIWPLNQEAIKMYEVKDHGSLYEFDVSKLGTMRVRFDGVDDLLASGRRITGPALLLSGTKLREPPNTSMPAGPTRRPMAPHPQRPAVTFSGWDRAVRLPKEKSADCILFEGYYAFTACLSLAEKGNGAPDIELHSEYRQRIEFTVKPGEITEVTLAADKLDEWIKQQSEWHKIDVQAAATKPAR